MNASVVLQQLEIGAKRLSSLRYVSALFVISFGIAALISAFQNNIAFLIVGLIFTISFSTILFIFHRVTQLPSKWTLIPAVFLIYSMLLIFIAAVFLISGRYLIDIPSCLPLVEDCDSSHPPIPQPEVELSIFPTLQFRTYTGYFDNEGRSIDREQRLNGPLALILKPIILNATLPAQSIVVNDLAVTIEFDDFHVVLDPVYFTEISPERARARPGDWLAEVGEFQPFAIAAGAIWPEEIRQIAFLSKDVVRYDEFLSILNNSAAREMFVTLVLTERSGTIHSTSCSLDPADLSESVQSFVAREGLIPSLVTTECEGLEDV